MIERTHWDDCWKSGPKHYECAVARADNLQSRLVALEDEKNTYIDYVGDALGQSDDESLWDAAQRVLSGRDRARVERDELSEQLTEAWISRDEQKARAEKAEAEVERLRAAANLAANAVNRFSAEADALRADAERYRWLRDRYTILLLNGESELRITYGPRANSKSGIDTAIDAARGES